MRQTGKGCHFISPVKLSSCYSLGHLSKHVNVAKCSLDHWEPEQRPHDPDVLGSRARQQVFALPADWNRLPRFTKHPPLSLIARVWGLVPGVSAGERPTALPGASFPVWGPPSEPVWVTLPTQGKLSKS